MVISLSLIARDALDASGCDVPTPAQNNLNPPPVPVLSITGVLNPKVLPSLELQKWGEFREDNLPIIKIAELGPLSQKIIDRVGW